MPFTMKGGRDLERSIINKDYGVTPDFGYQPQALVLVKHPRTPSASININHN